MVDNHFYPERPPCKMGCVFPVLHCTTHRCKYIDPLTCGYYRLLGPEEKAQLEELFASRADLFANRCKKPVEIPLRP